MKIFIIMAITSAFGLAAIIIRHLSYVRSASKDQLMFKVSYTKSFRRSFYNLTIPPLVNTWNNSVRTWFYRGIEEIAKKFRKVILRFEKIILRFTDFIRGKHNVKKNGTSQYWKDINEFKNEINNNTNTEDKE